MAFALSGVGCGYQRMEEIVIDASLQPDEIAMVEAAAELWFQADESLRLPVRVSDIGFNVTRGTLPEKCPRVTAYARVSPTEKPSVYLCSGGRNTKQTIAHELGHTMAGRDDHLSFGVMTAWAEDLPYAPLPSDIDYVRSQ